MSPPLTSLAKENGKFVSMAQNAKGRHKLHLSADRTTYESICTDLSLSGTTDAQASAGEINQTHRKIKVASADGADDVRYYHDVWIKKKIRPLILRSDAQY